MLHERQIMEVVNEKYFGDVLKRKRCRRSYFWSSLICQLLSLRTQGNPSTFWHPQGLSEIHFSSKDT